MNYVYMLRCSDNSLYTGWTNDIVNRVKKHNESKGAKYTRARLPVELVYLEKYSTKSEAMSREYKIKKLRKNKKEKMIIEYERSKNMKKIESFEVNHLKLNPGVYVSRKDKVGKETVTTFDIRLTKPNIEPVLNTAAIHAIEHIGATFLRNNADYKEKIIYFGPMGCRTGFYLILAGDLFPKDVVDLLREMFEFIVGFNGDIPGSNAKECGNYLDLNLSMAKFYSEKYLSEVLKNIKSSQMKYQK